MRRLQVLPRHWTYFGLLIDLIQKRHFRWIFFSANGGTVTLTGGVTIETKALPDSLETYDAIIIPGFFATEQTQLITLLTSVWLPAIRYLQKSRKASLFAASCYGTFVLAESGLLDGHSATTTWWQESLFSQRYPLITLNIAEGLIDNGPVITAGAMTAHTDLSLHVLRRLKGHSIARQVASVMVVEEGRSSQRPFMTLQRHFDDPLIDSIIIWMESHLPLAMSGTDLAAKFHISYRTLHRRFKSVTGKSPLWFLQELRVERAKSLLEETDKSADQIASDVGYVDVSSFRRLFLSLTSVTPAQYRKRFRAKLSC